jgi:hypothetical protein
MAEINPFCTMPLTVFYQVHEGPMRVAPQAAMSGELRPGVFFSDEPGYYKVLTYYATRQDTVRHCNIMSLGWILQCTIIL